MNIVIFPAGEALSADARLTNQVIGRCFQAKTGRSIAALLGISGMVNVDVIRDADGCDWVHDVNPRVWGSFAAFRVVGLDFLGAYVNWLRGAPQSAPRLSRQGAAHIKVFPAAFESPMPGEGRLHSQVRMLRAGWPYVKWVGPRYLAYELVHDLKQG